jgi:hypothetical protein
MSSSRAAASVRRPADVVIYDHTTVLSDMATSNAKPRARPAGLDDEAVIVDGRVVRFREYRFGRGQD